MPRTIHAIEAFDIKLPLPRALKLGAIHVTHRVYTMVRLIDSDGLVGTSIGLSRNAPIAQTVHLTIAPTIRDSNVDEYERTYWTVAKSNVCLGTNGIFWRALSLVDCAFHDLQARHAGEPLYKLLAGTGDPTPCILVGCYPFPEETEESLKNEVLRMALFQPAGIKIGSSGSLKQDTKRLEIARSVLPSSIPLMIDLYWQFASSQTLIPYAQRWQELGMGWIEDPFEFDDWQSATALANSISYPVAIGDEQCGSRSFLRLMDEGKVKVLRLDATVCGGISQFRSLANEARQRNIPVSCHVFPELHSQIAAATPNVKYVETFLPESGLDSLDLINMTPARIKDSRISPHSTPGNGYTWNEAAIAKYRTDTQIC
jgi:L-alanine-DL-glutamate epimerase-like enolase superfamily enzyme